MSRPDDLGQRVLAQAIVFAVLALCGVAILWIVASTRIDWFVPVVAYGFAIFVAAVRFGEPAEHRSTAPTEAAAQESRQRRAPRSTESAETPQNLG